MSERVQPSCQVELLMSESPATATRWKTGNEPVFNAPLIVMATIAVLAAIHLALWFAGDSIRVWFFYAFAFIPARFSGAYPMLPGSQYWSFLTYAFLHADWMHLFFNCLWLLVFGTPVARYLGTGGYLVLSAIAAVSGALASLILYGTAEVIIVGASGVVSGLLGGAMPLMMARRTPAGRIPLSLPELLSNGRALTFMAVWLAITIFSGAAGWTGQGFLQQGGIAWEAHVGGFIGGIAAFYLILAWRMRRA
jgi:membrane associated rhomboid family serine protease